MYILVTSLVSFSFCCGLYEYLKVTARHQKVKYLGCQQTHLRKNRFPLGLGQLLHLVKGDGMGTFCKTSEQCFLRKSGGPLKQAF